MSVITLSRRPHRRPTGRPVWEEKPSAAGQTLKGGTLAVVLALVIVPIYTIVLTSVSTPGAINRAGGLVLVPHGLALQAYRQMLSGGVVTRALLVSLGVTAVGTAISMA